MDFLSRFGFDRGKAVAELGSETLDCDHLMLEGFGASLIDASVVQSGGSQREELQQRRSLWTEARASCDIHEFRNRKFLPLDPLENWNVYPKVDAGHAIMVL
jgi:hypothetical protein